MIWLECCVWWSVHHTETQLIWTYSSYLIQSSFWLPAAVDNNLNMSLRTVKIWRFAQSAQSLDWLELGASTSHQSTHAWYRCRLMCTYIRRLCDYQLPWPTAAWHACCEDPIEAILVIFGRRALFFFCLKALGKIWKMTPLLCACAVSPRRRKKCRKSGTSLRRI